MAEVKDEVLVVLVEAVSQLALKVAVLESREVPHKCVRDSVRERFGWLPQLFAQRVPGAQLPPVDELLAEVLADLEAAPSN